MMAFLMFSSCTVFTAVLVLLLANSRCAIAQGCDSATGCTCVGSPGAGNNFTGIDFSKAFKYPLHILDDEENDQFFFDYSPCDQGTPCGDEEDDKNTAMCLFDSNFTDPVPINCGKATDITWQFSSIDPNQFTITYLDGDITEPSQFNRHTKVAVTIDSNAHKSSMSFLGQFTDIERKLIIYNFDMTLTPRAARGESDGGSKASVAGVVGLVLMLLLILAFITYLLVGVVINHMVKGAKGVELIPNVLFWKELPFLIKDGCCFTISPITKLISGGSNRHERQSLLTSAK